MIYLFFHHFFNFSTILIFFIFQIVSKIFHSIFHLFYLHLNFTNLIFYHLQILITISIKNFLHFKFSLALIRLLHPCSRAKRFLLQARNGTPRLIKIARWNSKHQTTAPRATSGIQLPSPLQLQCWPWGCRAEARHWLVRTQFEDDFSQKHARKFVEKFPTNYSYIVSLSWFSHFFLYFTQLCGYGHRRARESCGVPEWRWIPNWTELTFQLSGTFLSLRRRNIARDVRISAPIQTHWNCQ